MRCASKIPSKILAFSCVKRVEGSAAEINVYKVCGTLRTRKHLFSLVVYEVQTYQVAQQSSGYNQQRVISLLVQEEGCAISTYVQCAHTRGSFGPSALFLTVRRNINK